MLSALRHAIRFALNTTTGPCRVLMANNPPGRAHAQYRMPFSQIVVDRLVKVGYVHVVDADLQAYLYAAAYCLPTHEE
jgi:hypothetical protein